MTHPDPAPLPGLDNELAAGRRVVECQDCGRPLTGRDARMRGRGRGCQHKYGDGATLRRPGRFEVEQDELFRD